MIGSVPANIQKNGKGSSGLVLSCSGDWTVSCISSVFHDLDSLTSSEISSGVTIDTTEVMSMDTSGAWLIERLRLFCESHNAKFKHRDSDSRRLRLVEVVRLSDSDDPSPTVDFVSGNVITRGVSRIGFFVISTARDILMIFDVLGNILSGSGSSGHRSRVFRPISIVNQLDHMAYRAVPVIAVMSFLIGIIIAQQSAFQLRAYGEELLTVNLVGILLLREVGILLTAIMMAGRTGSAITAEIGTMKMREEIDALRVIGLNPVMILVLPRTLALMIALPLLVLVANFFGLLGSMVILWVYVDIPPAQFISTLQTAIDLSTVFAGLSKAPFMALLIALISVVEGLKVSGSAESLGYHTTISVVHSIFTVILIDGFFAIFFAAIDF